MQALYLEIKNLIITPLNLDELSTDDIDTEAALFGDGLGLDSVDAFVFHALSSPAILEQLRRPGGGFDQLRGQGRLAGALQTGHAEDARAVGQRVVEHAGDERRRVAMRRGRMRGGGHRATIAQ